MNRLAQVFTVGILVLVIVPASSVRAGQLQRRAPTTHTKGSAKDAAIASPAFQKALVVDDRLSALRREPHLQSEVIRRLRLGHAVYIVGSFSRSGQMRFCRVAVTRRTRGWIPSSALAVPRRSGEDERIMKLIENAGDGLDRIWLCRILIERFGQSSLVPRALLLLGEEADRAAETLTQRVRKRLAEVQVQNGTKLSDYYLNDAGLDRYSKLRIVFNFNESVAEFVYDGRAYREIVMRFPQREEVTVARQRLELASKKMARR